MTSRSANVLVIFIVAIFAFCFASVFASMTGTIAILPSNNDSDTLLDNVSIADENLTSNNYNAPSYTKQTDNNIDDSKDDDKSNVETTVDKTTSSEKTSTSAKPSSQDTSGKDVQPSETPSTGGDSSDIETTTED